MSLSSPFAEAQSWLKEVKEASCTLTPSYYISQTRSKTLITTHQLIATCGIVYKQLDNSVNTAFGNNFEAWLIISV